MFEKLRRPGRSYKESRTKKIFSYFVFGAICLVFVFLAPMGTQLIGEGVVAYVGNSAIRSRELRFMQENIKTQYQSRLDQAEGDNYLKIEEEIKERALQSLVTLYLIVQASQKEGFLLSDGELRDVIQSFPAFQKDGRFLYSSYISFLKNQGLSPSRFEARIRNTKLVDHWKTIFQQAVSTNQLEAEKKDQLYQYKVNFRYALLKAGEMEEQNLEPFVQNQNLKKVNSFLKKHNASWKKTGVFSLFSPFSQPIVQNQNIMSALIKHLPSTGLIPQLIRQSNKIYLIHVLSFEKGKIKAQERQIEKPISRNFDKSLRLLDSWVQVQRGKTKVKISDKI